MHGRLNRVVARCPECGWTTTVFRDPLGGADEVERMEGQASESLAIHLEDEHDDVA